MKILQICNKPPYPPIDGGAIGMNNVTLSLIDKGVDVDVLAVNTPKHFVDINELPGWYLEKTNIEFGFIDTDIKLIDALLNLFSKNSYNVSRFYSKSFQKKILSLISSKDYDIIQLESIFLGPYVKFIKENSSAKVILRAPNVEYLIWQRLFQIEVNPIKKIYLKLLTDKLKKYEKNIINYFDAIYTVTKKDKEYFIGLGYYKPIDFIPTGIDITKNLDFNINKAEFPSIFHLGALDWFPNQEGIKWFLDNIWDKIYEVNKDCKFHIAGRKTPKWMFNINKPNVIIHGEVEDAADFIKSNSIMIVPLFSGSGMRVKIIEGMMLGKAIISTSIGAEGLIVENDKDILIANTKQEFIDKLLNLIKDKDKYHELSNNAVKTSYKYYSNEVLADKLISFLNHI